MRRSLLTSAGGQQVGVMLGHRGHDDIAGGQSHPVGEVVERLSGIAADDRHVVAGAVRWPAGERESG
jgi:hypothetical protein